MKSRFQIILCMDYFCCSSLGLCHIQITDQQEARDKDCSFTQSALSHHSVIKRVEYTSASSRIFTCISKTVNCLQSVRFHFYNLIEDPQLVVMMAYSRKRLLWEPPSTKHGEWFASTFVLPTVPVIQFQASTSQHSSAMKVMYKTIYVIEYPPSTKHAGTSIL